MHSPDSSTKRASGAAEPFAAGGPSQRDVRPDVPVRSLEEFIDFLEAVEEVVGRDERPRGPTVGDRFLL
jgi:hypothetical protein